jgi:hypothetical protein
MLEEKPAHHPLEPLDVALKHTGWMPPAYLYLLESAKVERRRIVNSDFILLEVTPKARQGLLLCLLLSAVRCPLLSVVTCIQVELSPPFVY